MNTGLKSLVRLERIYDLLDHPAIDQYDIYRRIQAIFQDANYYWPKPIMHLRGFFRASVLQSTESFAPEIVRLSYPPEKYTGLGRCNWAGEPMFYCSVENGVPVYEVRAKKNTVFAMSKWVRKDCNTENTDGYAIAVSPSIIGIERIIEARRETSWLDDFLTHYKSIMPVEIQKIDAFLGDLFAKSYGSVPNLYWFTSAVARVILGDLRSTSDGQGLDALMYPSIQSQFTGYNLAVRPSFVDKHIKLQGAVVYQVDKYHESTCSYSIGVLRGLRDIDATGKAIWSNIHPDDANKRWELSPDSEIVYNKIPPPLRYEDEV